MRRFFADTTPLRTPDFRRLWLAGIVTVIGGNLTIFAVPVQLYALTHNSAYVGLSGLFALVPLVVFGLPTLSAELVGKLQWTSLVLPAAIMLLALGLYFMKKA